MARTHRGFIRVPVIGREKDESGGAARGIGNIRLMVPKKVAGEVKMAGNAPKRFKAACEAAGIPPTRRQLSKWNRKRGKAYTEGRKLAKVA